MRTAASILHLEENAAMEAALTEFRSQSGKIEQEDARRNLTAVEKLRRDYSAVWEIVKAFRMEQLGITEQDIAETMPADPPREL